MEFGGSGVTTGGLGFKGLAGVEGLVRDVRANPLALGRPFVSSLKAMVLTIVKRGLHFYAEYTISAVGIEDFGLAEGGLGAVLAMHYIACPLCLVSQGTHRLKRAQRGPASCVLTSHVCALTPP